MLRLSRKTMLALEAVLDVAYNARPDPVQSKDITARQGIPQRYLEQVMQQLVHKGILKGVRGPKGGYTLARERRRITVGDVVRIVDQLDAEADSEPVSQAELGEKVVAPLWGQTRDAILERLDRVTMEDLCRRARKLGIAHGVKMAPDFNI
jgi:Rrf2 family iron-sulfur cluster assembly transcriptional regulator